MLACLGFVAACWIATSLFKFYYAYYVPKRQLSELGPWAMITGCTDGIGRAYALQIARKNQVSLLLVARSEAKLAKLKEEIKSVPEFKKSVKTLTLDFTDRAADIPKILKEAADTNEVGCAIHCAGISYPGAQYFEELESEFLDELVDVNLRSTMHVIRAVLGPMKSRGRGAIICMGSGSTTVKEPLLSGYVGVKGGISNLCEALQVECRENNVLVQCQAPLLVVSKLSHVSRASLTVPCAEEYVEAGLRMIEGATIQGLFPTKTVVCPYWSHRLLIAIVNIVPNAFRERVRLHSQKYMHALFRKKLASEKA